MPSSPPMRLEQAEVGGADRGREVLLVGLRERVGVLAGQPRRRGPRRTRPSRRRRSRRARTGTPRRAGARGRPGRPRGSRRPAGGWTTKWTSRRRRLAEPHGELDRLAAQLLAEDPGEPLADVGVVAVARQVDQRGDVAAVGVLADEDPDLAALPGCITATAVGGELVDGVWNSSSRGKFSSVSISALPAWLRGSNAGALEHLARLLAQQRDPQPPTRCRRRWRTARGSGAPRRPRRSRRTS